MACVVPIDCKCDCSLFCLSFYPVFSFLQCWLRTVCVHRHNPSISIYPQASVGALVGSLGCYMAGIRYALELQTLPRGTFEPSQPEEDDTNQSVSSIEDDFVTALEHLEEDNTGDNPCRCNVYFFMVLNDLWFFYSECFVISSEY